MGNVVDELFRNFFVDSKLYDQTSTEDGLL
jgi:hypothetical protein